MFRYVGKSVPRANGPRFLQVSSDSLRGGERVCTMGGRGSGFGTVVWMCHIDAGLRSFPAALRVRTGHAGVLEPVVLGVQSGYEYRQDDARRAESEADVCAALLHRRARHAEVLSARAI